MHFKHFRGCEICENKIGALTTSSVKRNLVYNLINSVIKIIFPILIFPYVSRTLLPEGIGKLNYAEALVNYFVLFASMGIPIYGIREVARNRHDIGELKIKIVQIFSINLVFMLASYGALIIFILTGVVAKELTLIFIFMSLLFFSLIDMEWFFQGSENYKFITVRNLIVKTTTLFLIYFMVKSPNDISIYAFLLVLGTGGNSLFNFSYILRLHGKVFLQAFRFSFLKEAFKQHVRLILVTSSMAMAGSIYLSLDIIMLGNLSTDIQVGFYAASVKITRVLISVVLALTTVLLPRASLHVKNNNQHEFIRLFELGFRFILFVSLPGIAGLILLAEPIMIMFAGIDFHHGYPVLQCLSWIIILASINNLLGLQILYPLKKEKYFLYAIVAGAISSAMVNVFLIPIFGANGAALSAVLAESVILLLLLYHTRAYLRELNTKKSSIYLLATLLMSLVVWLLRCYVYEYEYNNMITLLLIAVGALTYTAALILMKESDFLRPMLLLIKNKLGLQNGVK